MKFKQVLAVFLSFVFVILPNVANAEEVKEKEFNVEAYKVMEINKENKSLLLKKVKEDNKTEEDYLLGDLVVHVSEDLLVLDSKSKEIVKGDTIKKDDLIDVVIRKNTPMAMSLPPQLTPAAIVIKSDNSFVKADKFNSEFISYGNDLKLNIAEGTKIVNFEGKDIKKEDIVDKDIIVLYGPTTFSIPAQTVGEIKIIALKELQEEVAKVEIESYDKVMINGKEVKLKNNIVNRDGVYMIPLRQVMEELKYEVKWNNKDRSVELINGPLWHLIKIGDNKYNFAKMIVELEEAPILMDAHTYIPFNVFEEGFKMETSIVDGVITINNK